MNYSDLYYRDIITLKLFDRKMDVMKSNKYGYKTYFSWFADDGTELSITTIHEGCNLSKVLRYICWRMLSSYFGYDVEISNSLLNNLEREFNLIDSKDE